MNIFQMMNPEAYSAEFEDEQAVLRQQAGQFTDAEVMEVAPALMTLETLTVALSEGYGVDVEVCREFAGEWLDNMQVSGRA